MHKVILEVLGLQGGAKHKLLPLPHFPWGGLPEAAQGRVGWGVWVLLWRVSLARLSGCGTRVPPSVHSGTIQLKSTRSPFSQSSSRGLRPPSGELAQQLLKFTQKIISGARKPSKG